jgi:aspartyl protease family protein
MRPFCGFLAAAALAATSAAAVEVNIIGLFPGKAVVVVDRGAPRTMSVGQRSAEGVLLVSVDGSGAVVEVEGKRERIELGQHFETASQSGARTTATLPSNERGQFIVDGTINGGHIRFLVDTGATLVALSAADAQRLGIDYKRGKRSMAVVADGRRVITWDVKLDSVTVGDLTLFNVDGSVHEGIGTGFSLLGMSFLGRTEMRREGANLTLIKRY